MSSCSAFSRRRQAECSTVSTEIDAVAGAKIELVFENAAANTLDVGQVANRDSLQP
jgi:hypothetical protein